MPISQNLKSLMYDELKSTVPQDHFKQQNEKNRLSNTTAHAVGQIYLKHLCFKKHNLENNSYK